MSKSKHYSSVEKKIFLEILKDLKHVVEVKKSDSSTLREKEVAWLEICNRYNNCTMISQERTVQQLKKLWANLKQSQREVLTKEKQARLATGGGPPIAETNIDPDIALITPHLMETAPVLFSSNMTENEINENGEYVINAVEDSDITILHKSNDEKLTTNTEAIGEIDKSDTIEDISDKENQNIYGCNEVFPMKRKENWGTDDTRASKLMKAKRTIHTFVNEDDIKLERIKRIMEQEKEMADIRKVHEETVIAMKEEFYTKLHTLEIRAAHAKAELAELQLQQEKKNMKALI